MKIIKLLVVFLMAGVMLYAQTAPTNLTGTVITTGHHKSIKLAWEGTDSGFVKFNVYKKVGALADTSHGFHKVFSSRWKTFNDFNVLTGQTYTYYVKSVINNIESEASNVIEVTLSAPVIAYGKISGALTAETTLLPLKGKIYFVPAVTMNGPQTVVNCDSNGLFSVRLKAGDYYMRSTAPGYISEYFDNVVSFQEATKITVAENDSLVYQVSLTAVTPPVLYTVKGWVKNAEGTPVISMVHGYLTNKTNNPHCHGTYLRAITDSLGNYTLTVRPNDTIVVYAASVNNTYIPEFYNDKATFELADRIPVAGNVIDINITLEPKPVYQNGISGDVMDSAGTTALKGKVYLYQVVNGRIKHKATVSTDTVTGAYAVNNLVPGKYIAFAQSRGYKGSYFKYDGTITLNWRNADSIVVTEAGVVTGVNFRLPACIPHGGPGMIFGSIKDNKLAVEGSVVYLTDAYGQYIDVAVTDADGSYLFESINGGEYTFTTTMPNFADAGEDVIINELENNVVNIEVTLVPEGVTSVENDAVVTNYALLQNYPNPFNPTTTISYVIPNSDFVTLKVYNILGKEVASLVNERQEAGSYKVNFNAANLASGIYFYKIEAGSFSAVKKLTLLK